MRLLASCRSGHSRPVACVVALLWLTVVACTLTDQADEAIPQPPTTADVTEVTVPPSSTSAATPEGTEAPDGCVPGAERVGAQSRHRLTSAGNEYGYLLYVPESAPVAAPLVVNFHGLGGVGAGQAAYTGYADLAEAEGFVVAHPSGLLVETAQWGATRNWEGIGEDISGRDDVQFVSDLIDRIATQACIDMNRVYATGFSNGGYFSAHLVCELADRIAATFSVGGISHPDECRPSRPVAMGAIHGTDDAVVPFDDRRSSVLMQGVQIDDEKSRELEAFFAEIIPDELAEFAAAFNCSVIADGEFDAETSLTTYTGCDGGVELRFYAVDGGHHVWPGSSWDKGAVNDSAADTSGISATADGWAFMSQYSLDR